MPSPLRALCVHQKKVSAGRSKARSLISWVPALQAGGSHPDEDRLIVNAPDDQWIFQVPVKGGRWHIIPTTFYGNQEQPLR